VDVRHDPVLTADEPDNQFDDVSVDHIVMGRQAGVPQLEACAEV
jgi:hypothetical protein